MLAHAYLGVPAPTTYIVPVEIQQVNDGRYGFKTVAKIPKIAGGAGTPLYGRLKIGREWNLQGQAAELRQRRAAPTAACRAKASSASKTGPCSKGR